nr:hypothetical protein GCM10020092_024580 [Actinoplanes digitatis]
MLGLTITVFVLVFLVPLYWMFSSAVKSPAEYALSTPTFIPHSWHPDTFATAWSNMRIAKYFTNTVLYAASGWLIVLTFDVALAYGLSKLKPVFGKILLGAILASLMLLASALLVPAYLTVVDVPLLHVNLLNTPWALWLLSRRDRVQRLRPQALLRPDPRRPAGRRLDRRRGPAAPALVDHPAAVPARPGRRVDLHHHRALEGLPLAAAGAAGPRVADAQRGPAPARQHQPGAADRLHG